MMSFDFLSEMYALAKTRAYKLYYISLALSLPDIDDHINKYKDGWLGTEGRFARVIARMLSQLD